MFRYPANHPSRKADPYTRRSSGKYAGTWTHRAPHNRWPYRIESLTDATPVVVVEGEKCADALAGLAREVGVLSWLGGSGAVLRTDWGALAGREVILWPDADDPGREAMARLAGELDRIGAAEVRMIDPEEDRPEGWDVADAIEKDGWGWKETQQLSSPGRTSRSAGVPPAPTGRRAGPGDRPARIESGSDRLDLGTLPACRGRDPDGRGARLRQELPEHRSGSGAVPGPDPVSPETDREDPWTAVLSLEDDPARTIVPRLKACGADLGEIVIFDWRHPEADSLETLSMREGTEGELLRVLREGVKMHGIRLVIVDTLTAFTPARMDGQ